MQNGLQSNKIPFPNISYKCILFLIKVLILNMRKNYIGGTKYLAHAFSKWH